MKKIKHMNTEYMTKKELNVAVNGFLKKATLKDQKWLYCYFSELDEWPIITDEYKGPLVPSQNAWEDEEVSSE